MYVNLIVNLDIMFKKNYLLLEKYLYLKNERKIRNLGLNK